MTDLARVGSRGAEVARLQELLNRYLQSPSRLKVDGIFGIRTEAAVRSYQSSLGLSADGIAGERTWDALERGVAHCGIGSNSFPGTSHNAPWMAVATREIGQKELDKGAHNPRILQYHATTSLCATADEVPWCSAFVNWCLRAVGIDGTNSAAARSWLHWGKISVPRPGAIVVMHSVRGENHVAFLLVEAADHFILLGGNQHDEVRKSRYIKSIWIPLGYRWPNILRGSQ